MDLDFMRLWELADELWAVSRRHVAFRSLVDGPKLRRGHGGGGQSVLSV